MNLQAEDLLLKIWDSELKVEVLIKADPSTTCETSDLSQTAISAAVKYMLADLPEQGATSLCVPKPLTRVGFFRLVRKLSAT